jgi:hypothetical protein
MTQAEQRVLELLADGGWHRESELRTTFRLLQWLYHRGLVDGAMLTSGGTADDRVWRLGKDGPG